MYKDFDDDLKRVQATKEINKSCNWELSTQTQNWTNKISFKYTPQNCSLVKCYVMLENKTASSLKEPDRHVFLFLTQRKRTTERSATTRSRNEMRQEDWSNKKNKACVNWQRRRIKSRNFEWCGLVKDESIKFTQTLRLLFVNFLNQILSTHNFKSKPKHRILHLL
jgi:hypothetical protein